jgi:hypothetical protein
MLARVSRLWALGLGRQYPIAVFDPRSSILGLQSSVFRLQSSVLRLRSVRSEFSAPSPFRLRLAARRDQSSSPCCCPVTLGRVRLGVRSGAWLSGRAFASHARGRWFDSTRAHHSRISPSTSPPTLGKFEFRNGGGGSTRRAGVRSCVAQSSALRDLHQEHRYTHHDQADDDAKPYVSRGGT